jgi:hypothetical protein
MVNRRRGKRSSLFSSNSKRGYRKTSYFVSKPKKPKKPISYYFPFIKYGLLLFLVLYALYFLFLSDFFKVKEVIIEGNSLVPKEELISFFPARKDIFLINNSKLKEEYLVQFREINNLEIYRGIPNAVKIVVVEREPRLIWQSSDKKYLISSTGLVIKEISDASPFQLPLVVDKRSIPCKLGEKVVSDSFIAFVSNVNTTFFQEVNIKPNHFEVEETTFDINLYTEAGFFIKLNTLRASKKQLENLKLVLIDKRPEIKEYVDLRVDGWAYYK